MAIDNFIATIWAARMLANLHTSLVWAQTGVVNRDYEGEIRNQGDSVRINAIGAVTISDYTKNAAIAAPETLSDAQTVLTISQGKVFNFIIDDVDRVQGKPDVMNGAMAEAAYAVANTVDKYVAALYSQAATANMIGGGGTVGTTAATDLSTAGQAYWYLTQLGIKLDEADVPAIGRWAIVPSWFHGCLQNDAKFVGYGTPPQNAILRNGVIGEAAGFQVLKSNNAPNPTGTTYKIVAGYPGAISFADQISKVEAFRPPDRFGDAVKGLFLYGGKVIRPTGLAVLTANKP